MTRRSRGLVLAATLSMLTIAAPAVADDVDDELNDIGARIDDLKAEMRGVEGDRSQLADDILVTQDRIDGLRVELDVARTAADEASRELNVERNALDRATDDVRRAYLALAQTRLDIDTTKIQAADAARAQYVNAGDELPEITFTAENLTEVSITVAYLERVTEFTDAALGQLEALETQEERQQATIARREEQVAAQVTVLAAVEARAVEQREAVSARRAEVEGELVNQRSLLADLDGQIDEIEGELAALEKEQSQIEQVITTEQSGGGTSPTGFVRPVPGAITSGFGPRYHPILNYSRMHTGVDMTAPYGQGIRAVASGRVILAGGKGGYGNTVIIDHGGGMTTLYAHQSSLAVSYGSQVDRGQTIGRVGSTGLSTGPHLHFEVRINGRPVDPATYLRGT